MNSNEWLCVEHECCEDNRRRAKWKYFLCGHIESAFDLCVKTINGGEQLQREQYSSCHSGFFFWKLGEMCQNHDLIWNSSWNSINVQMVKWISCSHSMASNSNAPNQFGISFVARENDKNVFYTLRLKVTRVSRHTQTEKKKLIITVQLGRTIRYGSRAREVDCFFFFLFFFSLLFHQNDLVQCWKCELCATEWQLQRRAYRKASRMWRSAETKKKHINLHLSMHTRRERESKKNPLGRA